jgi:HEAT repeat protein
MTLRPRRLKEFLRSLSVLVVALSAAPLAAGHGGTYRAPNLPPPPTGTPGPGGAGTGGPSTAGGGYRDTDPASWNQWWALNRDQLLPRFARVFDAGTAPGDGSVALGPGLRPSPETRHGRVVPALLAALERQKDTDLITASLMALAKIGDAPDAETSLVEAIRPYLAHGHQEVRETAAVALGVLGDRASAPLLVDLLHDTPAGRKLVKAAKVPRRTRAYAAYGLGMIGRRASGDAVRAFVVHHLAQEFEDLRQASTDLQVACVISIGLARLANGDAPDPESPPSPSASRQGQITFLLELLGDKRLDDDVLGYLPVALARLEATADPSAKELIAAPLIAALGEHARASHSYRHGALQALGLLGDNDLDALDQRIRACLMGVVEHGDRLERNLALVTLARVGGREGEGLAGTVPAELRNFLMERVSNGDSVERPWAAVAVGLLERANTAAGHPPAEGTRIALRHLIEKAASPSEKGALALALGLMNDQPAKEAISKAAEKGDESMRTHAITALGLLRAADAAPLLRDVAGRSGTPGLAREAAIALALIGDKDAWAGFAGNMTRSAFLSVQLARILTVGYCGDARAVAPLLELLGDERASETARAYAAVSLGFICDKDPTVWNAPLAEDMSWWKAPPTLFDPVNGRGVVDLY